MKNIREMSKKCDCCNFRECIGCEITYSEIKNIEWGVEELEECIERLEGLLATLTSEVITMDARKSFILSPSAERLVVEIAKELCCE